jgi:hypothetical protein
LTVRNSPSNFVRLASDGQDANVVSSEHGVLEAMPVLNISSRLAIRKIPTPEGRSGAERVRGGSN